MPYMEIQVETLEGNANSFKMTGTGLLVYAAEQL